MTRSRGALACAALLLAGSAGVVRANETPPPTWIAKLQSELGAVAQREGQGGLRGSRAPRFGVFVRDLESGAYLSWKAEERWYWASMVKLPVAIAVLRGVERGEWTLETQVAVRPGDYVDGAGPTSSLPVGAPASVRWLLEQMMVVSDNTASDMLIDLVGLAEVNATLQSLVPENSANAITTLADVRRGIWNRVAPGAGDRLKGRDLLAIRALPSDADRLAHVARLAEIPPARLRAGALDRGYDDFFASGANSGRLDAYGAMLKALDEGRALGPAMTRTLLAVMERTSTGTHRLRAGLPQGIRFAHKTGTQRRRVCDAGIVRWTPAADVARGTPAIETARGSPPIDASRERRAVIVACTRDEPSLERAEATLAHVALAVCRSGLFGAPATDSSRGLPADGTTAASFSAGGPPVACPTHVVAPRAPALDEDGRRAPPAAVPAPLPRGSVGGSGSSR